MQVKIKLLKTKDNTLIDPNSKKGNGIYNQIQKQLNKSSMDEGGWWPMYAETVLRDAVPSEGEGDFTFVCEVNGDRTDATVIKEDIEDIFDKKTYRAVCEIDEKN